MTVIYVTPDGRQAFCIAHTCCRVQRRAGEGEVGKQPSLQNLEHFRYQKNGEGECVLEYEPALNGWEKGIFSLFFYAVLQQRAGEEWREAQVGSPAGLAAHGATVCSQRAS